MDYFGWECSTAATNVDSSRSSQLHQMGDSLTPINGAPIEPFHADLKQKSIDMVQKLATTEPTNSPNYAANFNYLWRQAAMKLAADSVLATSEAPSSAEFSSSVKRPHVIDPLNGLLSDLVMPELHYPQYIDGKATIATNTGSLESLDCLLSTNNNIRNTSVEDDDFNSILHSDCKNLWNFSSISAVESENNTANITAKYCSSLTNEVRTQFSPKRTNQRIGVISEPELKRPRLEKLPSSSNINFQQSDISSECTNCTEEPDPDTSTQMKEMIYRAAAFRSVNIEEMEAVEKPKRKNVKISSDPQTVAARQRREKISEKIRVLQKLVPVGNKLDTASILDEAANYLKFLRSQVKALESAGHKFDFVNSPINPLLYHFPHHFLLPFNHSFPMQPNHDFSCTKPH